MGRSTPASACFEEDSWCGDFEADLVSSHVLLAMIRQQDGRVGIHWTGLM